MSKGSEGLEGVPGIRRDAVAWVQDRFLTEVSWLLGRGCWGTKADSCDGLQEVVNKFYDEKLGSAVKREVKSWLLAKENTKDIRKLQEAEGRTMGQVDNLDGRQTNVEHRLGLNRR